MAASMGSLRPRRSPGGSGKDKKRKGSKVTEEQPHSQHLTSPALLKRVNQRGALNQQFTDGVVREGVIAVNFPKISAKSLQLSAEFPHFP